MPGRGVSECAPTLFPTVLIFGLIKDLVIYTTRTYTKSGEYKMQTADCNLGQNSWEKF